MKLFQATQNLSERSREIAPRTLSAIIDFVWARSALLRLEDTAARWIRPANGAWLFQSGRPRKIAWRQFVETTAAQRSTSGNLPKGNEFGTDQRSGLDDVPVNAGSRSTGAFSLDKS
jgi:hypothetical protein